MINNCCFYGSLRRDMYNYEMYVKAYGIDNYNYIKTVDLPGFKLYNVNDKYPAAIRTYNLEDVIVVDLFELGENAFDRIDWMEKSANYYEDSVSIEEKTYTIFLFHENQVRNLKLVASGDWIKFLNIKN